MATNRFRKQLPKLIVLLVIFDLVQALCVGGIWYVSDLRARNAISARLGIKPSWKSLEGYIEANFNEGMTRDEVLNRARDIGVFFTGPFFIGTQY
jgi:hypothetical protein